PEDRDRMMATVDNSVKTKEPYSFYYRLIRPDGKERIVHSRGEIIVDEQGTPIRVLGSTQDVTESKKAEQILNESYKQIRSLTEHLQNIREEERKTIAREIHDELG